MDVSVIITAHREGLLAHRSIRSAIRAIRFAQRTGVRTELIAVLDRPDASTTRCFRGALSGVNRIVTINFGDPGQTRNRGATVATGRYVCFLDADDLFSENWIERAFRDAEARRDDRAVLHPEFNLFFGRGPTLSRHIDSTDASFDELSLLEFNYWTALSFVSRDFFLDGNQYAPTDLSSQLGFEDWHWNCQTLANSAVHRPVSGTVHFIRVKETGSLVEQTKHSRAVIRPSRLFEDDVMDIRRAHLPNRPDREQPPAAARGERMALAQTLFAGYRILRRLTQRWEAAHPPWSRLLDELTAASRRCMNFAPAVPDWLMDEWRSIGDIEPELYPTPRILNEVRDALRPNSVAARRYPDLSRAFGRNATHVFFMPDCVHPQTFRLLRAQLSATLESETCERIVCLSMEDSDQATSHQLPPGVEVVALAPHLSRLLDEEQDMLLVRLLLQKQPQEVHVIASSVGYRLLRNYSRALASQSELCVSLSEVETNCEHGNVGEATKTLPRCFEQLTRVYAENQHTVDKLCELFAFERDRFRVLDDENASARTTKRIPVAA